MDLPKKTLVSDYPWIWIGDPALDRDSKDEKGKPDLGRRYELYQETGDESHLPLREGVEPTRWTLRHLRPRDVRRVRAEAERAGGASATALALAAAIAIVSVDGEELDRIADPRNGSIIDPDILDAFDGQKELRGLIDSIGATAWRRASLDPK